MENALFPFGVAVVIMGVSLSGALFSSQALNEWMKNNLTYLASFSGGVFLIVVYHLLEETLHSSDSMALAAGAIIFGAALLEALHHLFPAEHHHHDTAHTHTHTQIDGRRVLISDALHNVGDGILLVAAFAVNYSIGLTAAIGIIVHELVQEISEYFVLREAGYTSYEALVRNFASSTTILVGVGVATFLSSADGIAVLFSGLAAGGFLAVMLRDLLPSALTSMRQRGGGWKHALALAAGIMLMLVVQVSFSHEEVGGARNAETTFALQNQGTLN